MALKSPTIKQYDSTTHKRKKTRQGDSHNTKQFLNKNTKKYTKPYRGQGRG